MKKLNIKQTMDVRIERAGYLRKNGEIYHAIGKLKIGQSVVFKKTEWKTKTHPNMAIPSLTYVTKRGRDKKAQELYRKSPTGVVFIGKKFSTFTVEKGTAYMVVRKK